MGAFFPHEKTHIARVAIDLLTACRWDVDVAHAAIDSLRPVAGLPELNDKGEPVEPSAKGEEP